VLAAPFHRGADFGGWNHDSPTIVIDGKGAFIFVPHSARSRNYLWIEDAAFCRGMQEYFEHLWTASLIIKDEQHLFDERFRSIQREAL